MTMRWYHPRLPHNSIAATLILLTLILLGGGVLSWHKAWLSIRSQQELQATSSTTSIRIPKSESLRLREKIHIFNSQPTPLVVQPGERSQLVHHIPTNERVIFITIDDGITKDSPAAEFMQDRKLPVTAFLTINDIDDNYPYFATLQKDGTDIENHTVSHAVMPKLPFDQQRVEICHTSNVLRDQYGKKPTLFRPPYGEYNDDTLRAAAVCGIKAVVLWSAVMQSGVLHYQDTPGLKPGDIILLHYKPELKQDLKAVFKAAEEQGFKIGRLEDWIK
jgi:peptidoglycan/xylan/chitin deacetylase (PgdA/CDA1 family)